MTSKIIFRFFSLFCHIIKLGIYLNEYLDISLRFNLITSKFFLQDVHLYDKQVLIVEYHLLQVHLLLLGHRLRQAFQVPFDIPE
nr:MAG TPA: hypothetical protein [Crassvirales sp.]